MPQATQVNDMFAGIAGRYDAANHWLSFGVDYYWRHVMVRRVQARRPANVVDLATGSGDVAFLLKKRLGAAVQVSGLDFCAPMLAEAEAKKPARPWAQDITFDVGDCLDLPLADDSVDVLTIAFGVRNLEDRHRGLTEMRRVLKPGGALVCLEFTQPATWFRPFYYLYLKSVLPFLARTITGNRSAYQYLAGSIEAFPTKESLAQEMTGTGFSRVTPTGLTASIVALHEAVK